MINKRRIGMLLAAILGTAIAGGQTPDSQPAQHIFPTTQAAVDTLLKACKDNDSAALVRMLGERYGE